MPAVDNFKSVAGGRKEKHWAEVGSVCSAQARQEKQRIKIIIEKKGNFLVKAVPLSAAILGFSLRGKSKS